MTLSTSSRQHRKSMLPTPRTSSRIGSRRTTSGDASRIVRHVPPPMMATPVSFISGSSSHSRVPHPASSRHLLPEFSIRRAGSPSRIPSPSIHPYIPTTEHRETAFPTNQTHPSPESGSSEERYPTLPAWVETKYERFKGQEGHAKIESSAQHQGIGARGPAPPKRLLSRRRASTALTS